jgi:hypothetical protein
VAEFAAALKAVDALAPQGSSRIRTYKPGIGPLKEVDAVSMALTHLRETKGAPYAEAGSRSYPGSGQECDLVIPGEWAIEFKLLRPFGDNGAEAEHWSENALHPYAGNSSSVGDALRLVTSKFTERKAVAIFGYEHTPARIALDPAVRAFELVTSGVAQVLLGPRVEAIETGLIHPFHQQLRVFAWEVLGVRSPST